MKVWVIDLESVETRYTCQWKDHVPKLLIENGFEVEVVSGAEDIPPATTPGAFLNFGGTNIYKSTQIEKMSRAFTEGRVNEGDSILFTDAWHPGIIQIKYMSELLGIKVITHGLWHAGSYDPADFLGRIIGDAPWVRYAEQSMFECFDHNYFATEYHVRMFDKAFPNLQMMKNMKEEHRLGREVPFHGFLDGKMKAVVTGWPMEYLKETLKSYVGTPKEDIILFPHRLAPEKQLKIFKDLAKRLPQYKFVVCMEQNLTKDGYHKLLAKSKMIFSANLQETLGISPYEGALLGVIPFVPNRLSYVEMYDDKWKYPSEYTTSWFNYKTYRESLVSLIKSDMESYVNKVPKLLKLEQNLTKNYFSATRLLNTIKKYRKVYVEEKKIRTGVSNVR